MELDAEEICAPLTSSANEAEDKSWLYLFPPAVRVMENVFTSQYHCRWVKYSYCFIGALALGVIIYFISTARFYSGRTSRAFSILFLVQFLMYLALPPCYFPLMVDFFISKDVKTILKDAVWLSSFQYLRFKFYMIFFVNMAVTTSSMTAYLYFRYYGWLSIIFTVVWWLFYIYPLSIVFGYMICLLEAHRMQAAAFRKKLVLLRIQFESESESSSPLRSEDEAPSPLESHCERNRNSVTLRGSSGDSEAHNMVACRLSSAGDESEQGFSIFLHSVEDITRQHVNLHDMFRSTADKRGHFLCGIFLLPITIILSSIWSIYEDFFSLKSTVGFIVMSTFYLLEVGLMVVTVNESGNLVSRDVASVLLRVIVHNSVFDSENVVTARAVHKMNGFISCLVHVRIEIPFFGNFTLRSRTLFAIVVSLLGAIIPGIIRNSM